MHSGSLLPIKATPHVCHAVLLLYCLCTPASLTATTPPALPAWRDRARQQEQQQQQLGVSQRQQGQQLEAASVSRVQQQLHDLCQLLQVHSHELSRMDRCGGLIEDGSTNLNPTMACLKYRF